MAGVAVCFQDFWLYKKLQDDNVLGWLERFATSDHDFFVSRLITDGAIFHTGSFGGLSSHDYTVLVAVNQSLFYSPKIRVLDKHNLLLFTGLLNTVKERADYENATGKVARFYYESETAHDWRVVKVEKVDAGLLRGKDLVKGEARSYRTEKISHFEVVQ